MDICLMVNVYGNRALWTRRSLFVGFLFVGLTDEVSVPREGGYTRRFAVTRLGCCSPHKGK